MYQVQCLEGSIKSRDWKIIKNNYEICDGDFKTVVRFAVRDLGFDVNDFERAVQALIYNSHNTLTFDRNRRLVSTSYQPPRK